MHLNVCWQWQVRSITQLNEDKRYVFLLVYFVLIIAYYTVVGRYIRVNIFPLLTYCMPRVAKGSHCPDLLLFYLENVQSNVTSQNSN